MCKTFICYDANALYLWAISQEIPTGQHENIKTYDSKQLKDDILNDEYFGSVQVDIEPQTFISHFSEISPIVKNAEINLNNIFFSDNGWR